MAFLQRIVIIFWIHPKIDSTTNIQVALRIEDEVESQDTKKMMMALADNPSYTTIAFIAFSSSPTTNSSPSSSSSDLASQVVVFQTTLCFSSSVHIRTLDRDGNMNQAVGTSVQNSMEIDYSFMSSFGADSSSFFRTMIVADLF